MKNICFIFIALFPTLAWAEPSIVFQTEKHDFGSVISGEQLEYSFEFKNSGQDILVIKEVNTS